jgi:ElaB/YqjD/DUF883 family membrane-anchored ribosome-binding protein
MADEDTARISEEVSGLKAEVAKVLEAVTEFIRSRGAEAAAKIHGTAEETWSEAKEKIGCVKKKIHEEPLAATAVAFGIGLVIGLIVSGRKR